MVPTRPKAVGVADLPVVGAHVAAFFADRCHPSRFSGWYEKLSDLLAPAVVYPENIVKILIAYSQRL